MDKKQFEIYDISQEKFEFATADGRLHDSKLETKPVGYFKDAFNRFRKNKSSVIAAIIILILILFAIIGPFCFDANYQEQYSYDVYMATFKNLAPKVFEANSGFWDGTKNVEAGNANYSRYIGLGIERGEDPIVKYFGSEEKDSVLMHSFRVDTYRSINTISVGVVYETYELMQRWQEENGMQLILPKIITRDDPTEYEGGMVHNDVWFKCDQRGNPTLDASGNFIPNYSIKGSDDYNSTRLSNDPGNWQYARRSGANGNYTYQLRVDPYVYFQYKYGFEPKFVFGSDGNGYDVLSRLASGARFSLLLAVCISAINLTIGAIYGAIEGYYGGATDMVMERISDILNGVPFMVVTVLFQLHLSDRVGVVPSLLFAFVMTGWIGMASRVRMQFYRNKNQEYVLAARTLGAKDRRIMWKHIFPNSLGTIITGSILMIPGVIFSETSLTYLGIVDLDGPTLTSIGSMLAAGKISMVDYPHIIFFPALFIALLMISFNLFGNGLRDAFNPSLRGSEE